MFRAFGPHFIELYLTVVLHKHQCILFHDPTGLALDLICPGHTK